MREQNPHLAPLSLGGLLLPSRIVAASVSPGGADDGGLVQPGALPGYARAAAGVGLVIAEPAWVSPQGAGTLRGAGIGRDGHVAAWSAVTDAVHGAGARIALPLWHAGRRAHPRVQPHGGWPVAPSAVAAPGEVETRDGLRPHAEPRALEATELPAVVGAFAAGAERALRAGFDTVEIHAADDGLVDQFLRPDSNRRDDGYGIGHAGRSRLLLEIVAAVAARVGADRLGVRIGAAQETVAALLAGQGLAWLHVVPAGDGAPPTLRRVFDGPIILGGGWPAGTASTIMANGMADAVALAPPSRADASARRALDEIPSHFLEHLGDGPSRVAPFLA